MNEVLGWSIFALLVVVAALDTWLQPKLDYTKDGYVLLWYTHKGKRKYKKLFKL